MKFSIKDFFSRCDQIHRPGSGNNPALLEKYPDSFDSSIQLNFIFSLFPLYMLRINKLHFPLEPILKKLFLSSFNEATFYVFYLLSKPSMKVSIRFSCASAKNKHRNESLTLH